MKQYSKLLLILLVTVFASCEDNRDINMVDDQLYMLHPGLQKVSFMEDGVNSGIYGLVVCKGGQTVSTATAKVNVNEALVSEYNRLNNTNYKLLPESLYELLSSTDCSFNEKTKSNRLEIKFDLTGIKNLQGSGNTVYVLPMQAVPTSAVAGDSARLITMVLPSVTECQMKFAAPGFAEGSISLMTKNNPIVNAETSAELNYVPGKNTTCEVVYAPEELVKYNEAMGINYPLLPEEAVKFTKSVLIFEKGSKTSSKIRFDVDTRLLKNGDNFTANGYVLPVKIKNPSQFYVNPEESVQFIYFTTNAKSELDRTGWATLEYNSCINDMTGDDVPPYYATLPAHPDNMLDNDVATFWYSTWDEKGILPYYFVFDMKAIKYVNGITLVKPTEVFRGKLKSGTFEFSMDNVNWGNLTKWEITDNAARVHDFGVNLTRARYIRFTIKDGFPWADGGTVASTQMNLSEFKVLGYDFH